MRHITTRTIALSIALAAALPAAAGAASHRYSSSAQLGPVTTQHGYPALNGTAVLSGPLKTNLLGGGAVVDRVKIVGNPMPNVFTLVGTEVAYFDRGAIRSAYTGWAMLHSDGTLAVRIRGHVTGGSGAYRRARGSYVFTGATPAGSDVTSGGSKGTITY
jgi:hypothetical protein